jgi:hypothetical protein
VKDAFEAEAEGGAGRLGLGTAAAAARASPVADVSEVLPVVGEGAAAGAAPASVEGAGEVGGEGRVVEAEPVDRAKPVERELGDGRVVGVEDECGARGREGEGVAPEGGDGVDFAVAVELVAEEVGEGEDARLERLCGGREGGFVDLEEAEGVGGAGEGARGAGGGEQGAADARIMFEPSRLCR